MLFFFVEFFFHEYILPIQKNGLKTLTYYMYYYKSTLKLYTQVLQYIHHSKAGS